MGLSAREIELSRRTHGENRFTEQKKRGFFFEFFKGFSDPLILILLIALLVNLLFVSKDGGLFEACGISAAILLSVFVSTLSEYTSQKAFEKLSEDASRRTCRVRRDGAVHTIVAADLVVGDVVLLNEGEFVPADGCIVYGECAVDQSALNGESREAQKHPSPKASSLSDEGAVFSGTLLLHGQAEMQVTAVGDQTLYGKLAGALQETPRKSPLKEKLSRLAKTLSFIGYAAAALVAGADLLYFVFETGGGDLIAGIRLLAQNPALLGAPCLHAVTLAVTVVVVAVPEGLPMMITVVLSSQMKRMLKEGVLLRKLSGIETAGTMDLLFCDKTGTLTEGRHSVQNILLPTQTGLADTVGPLPSELCDQLTLNNQAHVEQNTPRGANATDRALLSFALAHKLPRATSAVKRRIPFESALKYSAVELEGARVLIKGAPETILSHCNTMRMQDGKLVALSETQKKHILSEVHAQETQGMRMIAFAHKKGTLSRTLSCDFILCAFAALSDALRAETAETVLRLQGAGVQLVMLTGDSKAMAVGIARRAGILKKGGTVLSSEELCSLSDQEALALLDRLCVVYRCQPTDKSRLAKLASQKGRITGMTGDGVNDAPALKIADVGFAMGSGTQIAKESADVVLTDDRLSSLTRAVLYGRTVFRSICKFLTFQLTMNFCAVLISFLGPMFGVETPIGVLQMLWVNLIMDTLASLAFAGEAPRESYLKQKPLKRTAPILSREVCTQIVFGTLYSVLVCCLAFASETLRKLYGFDADPRPYLSAFFLLFVSLGLFNMLNVRTPRQKLWASLSKNPGFLIIFSIIFTVQLALAVFGFELFSCVALPPALITLPLLGALTILPADLLRKGFSKRQKKT